MAETKQSHKVVIVGAGRVGSTFAYALALKGSARAIALVDLDRDLAQGEAMDLNHSLSHLKPMDITSGGFEECADAAVVVVTAGGAQKPGETRLDLAGRNAAITRQVVASVLEHNPDPVLVMVTNPVDVLTSVAQAEAGLAPGRVLGSGTVLDSARFRVLLSQHCGVDPRNVHAQVIGEHGDSEVAVWSGVRLGGLPLAEFCALGGRQCGADSQREITRQVREAAYEIIKRKGATNYGIGVSLVSIVEAILRDQDSILTVSTQPPPEVDLGRAALSLPAVVGAGGVKQVFLPQLDLAERQALETSAQVLAKSLADLGMA